MTRHPGGLRSRKLPARLASVLSVTLWLPLAGVSAGCRQDMPDQPRYKPYAKSDFFADNRSARSIVEGTVARGQLREDAVYHTGRLGKGFATPLPSPLTAAVLERGRERYTIYCTPCHGQTGRGDGMVVRRGFHGDVDCFRFEGVAGDRIVADIDTPTENPPKDLDLILFLLDNDGRSVLAIHDDEETSIRLDPHLGYKLTRSGTYYLKARLWSHPSIGGNNYTYSLRLSKDLRKPNATFSYPATGDFIPGNSPITLTVSASDTDSGVRRVEFLYHSRDWISTSWQILGIDNNDQDGWTWEFDPALASEGSDYAFYANVYDWAGNWFGTGSWTIGLDRIPPTTSLKPLSATQPSTAVLLEWTGSDGVSGIDHFELQSQIGTSTWNDYSPDPAGNVSETWFTTSNNNYGFPAKCPARLARPSAIELFRTSSARFPLYFPLTAD